MKPEDIQKLRESAELAIKCRFPAVTIPAPLALELLELAAASIRTMEAATAAHAGNDGLFIIEGCVRDKWFTLVQVPYTRRSKAQAKIDELTWGRRASWSPRDLRIVQVGNVAGTWDTCTVCGNKAQRRHCGSDYCEPCYHTARS